MKGIDVPKMFQFPIETLHIITNNYILYNYNDL